MQQNPTIRVGQTGATNEPAAQSNFPTQVESEMGLPEQNQHTIMLDQSPPTFAWIAIVNGLRAGRLFPLEAQGTTIGRDAQNDIVLDDTAVSRQHAKIRPETEGGKKKDQFYVHDLGSSNHTYLNGRRIDRALLRDGDEIRIGETRMIFKTIAPAGKANKPAKKRAKRKAVPRKKATNTPEMES
jgi:hypothetical protein